MKKRVLSIILVFTMVLASFSLWGIKAEDEGVSMDTYKSISFSAMSLERSIIIYNNADEKETSLEGVTYDVDSNTLTFNNFNTNYYLSIFNMGKDFKLKLVGTNSIPMMGVSGGGSLTITGTGVLNVDTSKFEIPDYDDDEGINGIVLYSDEGSPTFTVEKTATVNIKASGSVIIIADTLSENGEKLIKLQNGKDISASIKKERDGYDSTVWEDVLVKQEDYGIPEEFSIYSREGETYGVLKQIDQYIVRSKPFVYDPVLDIYFTDPTDFSGWTSIYYDSEEEFLADGYEFVADNVVIQSSYDTENYQLYEDKSGNTYAVYTEYDNDGNITDEAIYEIIDSDIVLSDGITYKMTVVNNQVNRDDLKEVTKRIEFDTYSYIVDLKTINIKGETNSEIVVEAADEDSNADTLASEEVLKLIEAIIEDDETVEGIDEELSEKIREKVEAGETIYVEVAVEEVDAEDIADDVKKVEEAVGKNDKIVSYFNIDIVIKTDDEVLGTVTNLQDKIKISIDVPEGLPAVARGYKRVFKIVRVHDGKTEELPTTVSGGKIEFESDLFSTFALIYEDEKITKNPGTGDKIIFYFAALAVATVGIVFTVKSFKKEEE